MRCGELDELFVGEGGNRDVDDIGVRYGLLDVGGEHVDTGEAGMHPFPLYSAPLLDRGKVMLLEPVQLEEVDVESVEREIGGESVSPVAGSQDGGSQFHDDPWIDCSLKI